MSKVLLTGIDGFTGRYMAAALAARGHEVHGLVHRLNGESVLGATALHEAGLGDAVAVREVVQRVQPQRVAHLAAISFVAHGDAEAMYTTNLLGTRNLLEALVANSVRPESVLLASSANIYGNGTEGPLDEQTSAAPANDYAVSKLAMEYLAHLYASRLPIIISRPFNYTGVGQDESFLLPKIVAHVKRAAPVIELGNLHVARDFSDVRMVVQAYLRLLETTAAVGQTFNVCSGKAYTLTEILDLVREVSGRDFEVRVNPSFVRANEVKTLVGIRAKLDACVGTLDVFELRETLRWMLSTESPAPSEKLPERR
jgi:GDP-6-deoxy-D-talose 4-dehydrogenase